MENPQPEVWDHLRSFLEEGDYDGLDEYLASLSGPDVLRAVFRLTETEQRQLLTVVTPQTAADFIQDVPDEMAADLIERIPAADAALIVTAMASDEQADLLTEVDTAEMSLILEEMEPESAASALELMSYAADAAGGLMSREFFSFTGQATAREALIDVTAVDQDLPRYALQHVYVISGQGRLLGWVRVRDLVSTDLEDRLSGKMNTPIVVNVDTELSVLRDCFHEVDFLALPVVDDDGMLRGVVLRSHVEEALTEKAEDDFLKSQGIVGGEELRAMPLIWRCRQRLSWLSVNIVLNIIAASVIVAFEETLASLIALAVFLPIVSDMSGCSGNQAVAISMRELSLGIVNSKDVFRVWLQEIKVGLINGVTLGVLLGAAAWAWKGSLMLSLVVGLALSLNTVVAVSIGGCVPLFLKRFGVDPAVASGPVLTTVTDMCGFALVLGIASQLL